MQEQSKPRGPLKFCQSDSLFVELVRRRAYELYVDRGMEDGHDVEDWLHAEEGVLSEDKKPIASAA